MSPGLAGRLLLPIVLALCPSAAGAHAFTAGQGGYSLFVEGTTLIFHTPPLAISVVSLGFLIGIWKSDGMPLVWPAIILGTGLGLAFPLVVVADLSIGLYVLALVLGTLSVLHKVYGTGLMRLICGIAAAMIAYGVLALHGSELLPVPILFGIFVGVNVIVPMIAGVASLPRRWTAAIWPSIGLRIIASWQIAVTLIMFSFALR